jgi:hypothetical protein
LTGAALAILRRPRRDPPPTQESPMPAAPSTAPPPPHAPLRRLVRAGLLTAVTDGLFSSVLAATVYGSTATRLWQGVAATVLGPQALAGGGATAAFGLLLHLGVAFGWSAVFLALTLRSRRLRALLATPAGKVGVAAVYGPAVWLVMSLVVLPLLLRRPPTITGRWWVQLVGHAVFVGLPIVWGIGRGARAGSPTPAAPPAAGARPPLQARPRHPA